MTQPQPLATPADLGRFLGRTLSEDEDFRARMLLAVASEAVRGYCRQTLTYVASETVILTGNWGSELVLPERPVTAVTSASINSTSLSVNVDFVWDGASKLYRGSRQYSTGPVPYNGSGQDPMRHELHWGGPSAQVTVVYSHGLTATDRRMTLPRGIVCELAAAGMAVTPGIRQESLGQYSYTAEAGASRASELSAGQRRALRDAGLRR